MGKKKRGSGPLESTSAARYTDVVIDAVDHIIPRTPAPPLDPPASLAAAEQVAIGEVSAGAHDDLTVQHSGLPYPSGLGAWLDHTRVTVRRRLGMSTTAMDALTARISADHECADDQVEETADRLRAAKESLDDVENAISQRRGRVGLAVARRTSRWNGVVMLILLLVMSSVEILFNISAFKLLNVTDGEAFIMGFSASAVLLLLGWLTGRLWVQELKTFAIATGISLVCTDLLVSGAVTYLRIQLLAADDETGALSSTSGIWMEGAGFFAISMMVPVALALLEIASTSPLVMERREWVKLIGRLEQELADLKKTATSLKWRREAASKQAERMEADADLQEEQAQALSELLASRYYQTLLREMGDPASTSAISGREQRPLRAIGGGE